MERRKFVYVVNARVEIDHEEHHDTLGVFNSRKKAEEAAHKEIFDRYESDVEEGMIDEENEKPQNFKEGAWRYNDSFQGYYVSVWINKLELGAVTTHLTNV